MARTRIALLTLPLSALWASAALALPPTNSEVVFVRQDCSSFFAPTYCVQSMADVNSWIPTRDPVQHPVLIDVGPGTWGAFTCMGQDSVTVRGAGRDTTRLVATGAAGTAMLIADCENLAVESLTAQGSFSGVQWGGTSFGSSTWTDTDIIAGGTSIGNFFAIGWYDASCGSADKPLHYFFGSRVMALGHPLFNLGFLSQCAEHWFFGGEIQATNVVDRTTGQAAVFLYPGAVFHAFGTTVRSTVGESVTHLVSGPEFGAPGGMHGVYVKDGADFHSHGAIVSVDGSDSTLAQSVTGIRLVGTGGFAHTHETGFVVNAATGGTSTRLAADPSSNVQSPFLWHQGTAPPRSVPGNPTSAFVTSIRGADLFVETDCTTSNCNGTGTVPRLMIHRPECTGANGPWWDARANACR